MHIFFNKFYLNIILKIQGVIKKNLKLWNNTPTGRGWALRLLSARNGMFRHQTAICRVSPWTLVGDLQPQKWERTEVRPLLWKWQWRTTCVSKILLKTFQNFRKTFQRLGEVHGKDCMSCILCYKRLKRFEDGKILVGDSPKPQRPSISTDDAHVESIVAVTCKINI